MSPPASLDATDDAVRAEDCQCGGFFLRAGLPQERLTQLFRDTRERVPLRVRGLAPVAGKPGVLKFAADGHRAFFEARFVAVLALVEYRRFSTAVPHAVDYPLKTPIA